MENQITKGNYNWGYVGVVPGTQKLRLSYLDGDVM